MCVRVPECVQHECVWLGVQERLGFGAVCAPGQLDLAKAQINTNMNSSFLSVFPHIANTHLWCGSEGKPPYTAYSVPASLHVGMCVCVRMSL